MRVAITLTSLLVTLFALTGCGESEAAKEAKVTGWVQQVRNNPALAESSDFLSQLTDYADLCAPEFARLLREDNKPIQIAGLKVLASLKRLSVYEELVRLLRSPDPEIRRQLAETLGSFASPLTVKPLMELAKDPNPSVRGAALKAMGQKGDRDAPPYLQEVLPYLTDGLRDPDGTVRRGAVQGLVSLGPWALQALARVQKEGAPVARQEAQRALRYICEAFRRDLRESTDRLVRRDMARYLSQLRYQPAISDLLEKLQEDPDPEVKAACAYALGNLRARSALSSLSEILRNTREETATRIAAAVAMGQMGREEGIGFLIKQLNSSEEKVRASAVDALRTVGRAAERLLIRAAENRDTLVRWGAVAALGTIGGPRALPVLRQAVEDPNPSVRAAAVAALGDLGLKEAETDLISALSDKDRYVRAHADRALEKIGRASAAYLIEALDSAPDPARILRLLGRLKAKEAADRCRRFLSDKRSAVRSAAAFALGEFRDLASADSLLSLLSDKSASVRRAAALALAKIGSARHLRSLEERVITEKDETARTAFLSALRLARGL